MATSNQLAQFIIRQMGPDDIDKVSEIERVASEHPWSKSSFQNCFDGGYHCFVGCIDEQIVAFGVLSCAVREGHIQNIAVCPDYQGAGFGRELLSMLLEEAEELGAKTIFLEVSVENSVAFGLYLSYGFREIGQRKDYYKTADGRKNARIMRKNFGKERGLMMLPEMIRRKK
ncbi:MAG: ribosomal protein S18-alanine N-acetyltransferase [Pseudomonadales bacterium]|nr:ribosomal protein S18-alanine N-acetyltransferase [Pseudomonadales bacterium]